MEESSRYLQASAPLVAFGATVNRETSDRHGSPFRARLYELRNILRSLGSQNRFTKSRRMYLKGGSLSLR
jgi:hypothetical protein